MFNYIMSYHVSEVQGLQAYVQLHHVYHVSGIQGLHIRGEAYVHISRVQRSHIRRGG